MHHSTCRNQIRSLVPHSLLQLTRLVLHHDIDIHKRFSVLILTNFLQDARPGRTVVYTFNGGEKSMSQKLRNDLQDAIAMEVSEQGSADDRGPYKNGPRVGTPEQRILCVGMNRTQHLASLRVRHAIFQALPRSIDQLLRASRVTGTGREVGRCTVLLSGEEISLRANQEAARCPSLLSLQSLIQQIFGSQPMSFRRLKQLNGPTYAIRHQTMARQYQLSVERIFDLFKFLEKNGYVRHFNERAIVVSEYEVLRDLAPPYGALPHSALIKHLLERGRTGEWDLFSLSESLGIDAPVLLREICELEIQGVLKLVPRERLSLLEPRKRPSDEEIDSLARAFHANLVEESERRAAAGSALVRVFTTARCIVASMAEELGAQVPGGRSECGRCTFCVTRQPVVIRRAAPKPVNIEKVRAIHSDFPELRHDPRLLARIALGISPIVGYDHNLSHKMSWRNPLVGSMRFCDFKVSLTPRSEEAPCIF